METNTNVLEVFSDYACTWCYFATSNIERLKKEHDINIKWTAYSLHPDTPEEGVSLSETLKNKPVSVEEAVESMKKTAQKEGLQISNNIRTFNTRLLQELSKWAETEGKGDEFHKAAYNAYYVDVINIAKINELLNLSESVGLSRKKAKKVIDDRTFKDHVDEDYKRAEAMDVCVIPTFVVGDNMVVGSKPYEILEKLLFGKTGG